MGPMARWLRRLRKTLTFGGLRVGMEFSRRADGAAAVEALRVAALGATRVAIPLRMRLRTNTKLAGVYRPGLERAYFERAIDQMIMLAHVFRAGFPESGCPEKFRFGSSIGRLAQARAAGQGVICIAPHICGYPLYAPAVSPRIPCSIYVRRNKDRRKMRITEAVGVAGGGDLIYPPEGATRAQRLQVAIRALRQGKVLFITPDTPRKPKDGVAVSIFGRTVFFPAGVFVMSMRTGAPVVPAFWHWADGHYQVSYDEPTEPSRTGRSRRQAERATRHWAARVDAFLHEHPEMWWNWLDKRWTRILRDQHAVG